MSNHSFISSAQYCNSLRNGALSSDVNSNQPNNASDPQINYQTNMVFTTMPVSEPLGVMGMMCASGMTNTIGNISLNYAITGDNSPNNGNNNNYSNSN